jgi:glycosyltransferase EpsD
MACGLPVVASDNRGHRDIIISDRYGKLYDATNAATFIDAVIRFVRDKEFRTEIGNNNKTYAETYAIEKIARELINIYVEVLGET